MSGTELSRVRTEFRLRPPEPINESDSSRARPTLLCNQVGTGTDVSTLRSTKSGAKWMSPRRTQKHLFLGPRTCEFRGHQFKHLRQTEAGGFWAACELHVPGWCLQK